MLRNNKHTGIETSNTRRWFCCSLLKQLIHFLLSNEMMSCSCLNIELPEVMEQGRVSPKLKMVTWTILSTNWLEVMLLHWSKKWESIPTCKTADEDDEEAVDCDTSGVLTPMVPILPVSVEPADTLPPADFLTPGWVSVPLSKWGLLAKEAPLDPGTGLFWTVKWNPGCGLALLPLLEGKDWDKPMEDCCWACARNQLIWPYRQASLGRNHILETVKKKELWNQDLATLPGSKIKHTC